MSGPCKFKRGQGWNCGSWAFNLAQEDIEQGDLCDRHYWQLEAITAHLECDAMKERIQRLRGLCKSASGWLLDADDIEHADLIMELIGDAP